MKNPFLVPRERDFDVSEEPTGYNGEKEGSPPPPVSRSQGSVVPSKGSQNKRVGHSVPPMNYV